MAEAFAEVKGKLGFGLMRLPRRLGRIDDAQVAAMVDAFMEAGFSYFDTARIYPGSEAAAQRALVARHARDSFQIATKLNTMKAPTRHLARREIEVSLKNLRLDYVDYYLLHSLMGVNYASYDALGLWDFAEELKQAGKVRHWGFSFHGGPELLDRLLAEHPQAEFVQLQINYADWDNPRVTARENYNVARAHNKPIVVMEPVKGGALANPPTAVQALFDAAEPGASYASWALRFVANLPGVASVLSGMSDMAQVQDNLATFQGFTALSEEQSEVLRQARRLMGSIADIPCTACGYCKVGCPQGIDIPAVFAAMNLHLAQGRTQDARAAYAQTATQDAPASACIACGACERACPQHIDIVKQLRACANALE